MRVVSKLENIKTTQNFYGGRLQRKALCAPNRQQN